MLIEVLFRSCGGMASPDLVETWFSQPDHDMAQWPSTLRSS